MQACIRGNESHHYNYLVWKVRSQVTFFGGRSKINSSDSHISQRNSNTITKKNIPSGNQVRERLARQGEAGGAPSRTQPCWDDAAPLLNEFFSAKLHLQGGAASTPNNARKGNMGQAATNIPRNSSND